MDNIHSHAPGPGAQVDGQAHVVHSDMQTLAHLCDH